MAMSSGLPVSPDTVLLGLLDRDLSLDDLDRLRASDLYRLSDLLRHWHLLCERRLHVLRDGQPLPQEPLL